MARFPKSGYVPGWMVRFGRTQVRGPASYSQTTAHPKDIAKINQEERQKEKNESRR